MSDTRELAERIFLVLIASETAGTFEHEANLALEAAERFNAVADRKLGDPRMKLPLNYRDPADRWVHGHMSGDPRFRSLETVILSGHWPIQSVALVSYRRRDGRRVDLSIPIDVSPLTWIAQNLAPVADLIVISWTDWPRDPTVHMWHFLRAD